MGELGDLLELLHRAGAERTAIRATYRQWQHTGRALRAWRRAAEREGGAGFVWSAGDPDPPQPAEREELVRLWLEPDGGGREQRGEWVGDTSLGFLADPLPFLGRLRLEVTGPVEVAGRAATAARGRARPGTTRDELSYLALSGDEVEVAVDHEHGVLLRVGAVLDGEQFSVLEAVEIAFGEPSLLAAAPPPRAPRSEHPHAGPYASVTLTVRPPGFPAYEPEGGWREHAGALVHEQDGLTFLRAEHDHVVLELVSPQLGPDVLIAIADALKDLPAVRSPS